MKPINVLSCFDGLSGGRIALDRLKIPVNKYFAFEIDKYAMKIAAKNVDVIHLGDIKGWEFFTELPKLDLLLAGFPCQSYSIAGKRLGLDDVRGSLLYDLLNIINYHKPKEIILENVKGFLSASKGEVHRFLLKSLKDMGYNIHWNVMNSSLVSAQNRERVYYTSWAINPPEDRGIVLKDILENGYTDRDKSYCIDANYFKGGNYKSYFGKGRRQLIFDSPIQVGEANLNGHDILKRVYSQNGKSPTVSAHAGGNQEPKVDIDGMTWRKLTPLECERLQTLPDNTTFGVSNTQRYKMIGNGFTIEMIANHLKQLYKEK